MHIKLLFLAIVLAGAQKSVEEALRIDVTHLSLCSPQYQDHVDAF